MIVKEWCHDRRQVEAHSPSHFVPQMAENVRREVCRLVQRETTSGIVHKRTPDDCSSLLQTFYRVHFVEARRIQWCEIVGIPRPRALFLYLCVCACACKYYLQYVCGVFQFEHWNLDPSICYDFLAACCLLSTFQLRGWLTFAVKKSVRETTNYPNGLNEQANVNDTRLTKQPHFESRFFRYYLNQG